jgi:hypothetical protein
MSDTIFLTHQYTEDRALTPLTWAGLSCARLSICSARVSTVQFDITHRQQRILAAIADSCFNLQR